MDSTGDSPATVEEQVTPLPPVVVESVDLKPSTTMSLKQIYGMLCWLQVGDNSKKWKEQPLKACKQAVGECPHLVDADAEELSAQMDDINEQRLQKIAEFGDATNVPQDTRVFPGGPLFTIVDYALSGHCASGLVEAHGTGRSASDHSGDAFAGPIRNSRQQSIPRPEPYMNASSLISRARRLSPAEIKQMRDEMAIRREIAMRDAILLADWTALKRRELEVKEMKLRELIRSNHNGSIEGLLQFEEYINSVSRDGI
ncbi:hypothetical protein FBU31_000707 [Coemansia sp. 'formosensis']|nr:hypothetical protein FBU31_000707 [Coemansia sp. 'formosensis']